MSESPTKRGHTLPDAEYEAYIEKYPFAAEATYFTRPNRFYGPASTWRSYTEHERGVSDGLATIEASDLSIHLYNSFVLRQKDQTVNTSRSASRGRSTNSNNAHQPSKRQKVFTPPDVWTAWPMRIDQLPMNKYGNRESASEALEQSLAATILRFAKEQWNARERQTSEERQPGTDSQVQERSRSPISSHSSHSARDILSRATSPEYALPEGVQTFSSQAFLEETTSDEEENTEGVNDDEAVLLADDEEALEVMRPALRHVMSKADDLLHGLHTARAAYADKGQSRSRSRSMMSTDTDGDYRFIRTGSKGAVVKEMRKKRKRPTSVSGESPSTSRGRSSTRAPKRKKKLRLRDWSDVIGLAAMKGFPPEVIARASERCAKLFDENMMFRTFTEGGMKTNLKPAFLEEYALGDIADADNELSTQLAGNDNYQSSTASELQPTIQAPQQSQELASPQKASQASQSRRKHEHREGHRPSLYDSQTVQSPTHHEHDNLPDRARAFPNSPALYSLDADDLICPVPSCPKHTYHYGRPARLYDHIRRTHPGFDLDAFQQRRNDAILMKKLQSSPRVSPSKRLKLNSAQYSPS